MAMATVSRRYAACVTRLVEAAVARGGSRCARPALGVPEGGGSAAMRWLPLIQARHLPCCAGLGTPRAPEIIVEYDERDKDNTDFFIQLADGIEEQFPDLNVLGNPDDMQPRTGAFEISRDGQVLFSMIQAKRLPTLEELIKAIEDHEATCELPKGTAAA